MNALAELSDLHDTAFASVHAELTAAAWQLVSSVPQRCAVHCTVHCAATSLRVALALALALAVRVPQCSILESMRHWSAVFHTGEYAALVRTDRSVTARVRC